MYQMADIYSVTTTMIASGKLSVLEKYMKLTFKHLLVVVQTFHISLYLPIWESPSIWQHIELNQNITYSAK